MGKEAGPFVLTLTDSKAKELEEPVGGGGHQSLHARLVKQLAGGNRDVSLNDRELGELIRYMTRYGSGGFQGRLRRAFIRPLRKLLDLQGRA